MTFWERLMGFFGSGRNSDDVGQTAPPSGTTPDPAAPAGTATTEQGESDMGIWEHYGRFGGKDVVLYTPGEAPPNPGGVALRVGEVYGHVENEDVTIASHLEALAKETWASEVTALVIGAWASWEGDEDAAKIAAALVAAAPKLTGVRHLFFADIIAEESEISWIEHTNVSGVLKAFPELQTLRLRGGGITFGRSGHSTLRKLIVESGGMDPAGVADVAHSKWPALTHLELWLGTDEYGGGSGPEHWGPLLSGDGIPAVKFLGLMNSDRADEVAIAAAAAPVLPRLSTLDLSMGTLGDDGARALLDSPMLQHVGRVNLRHNYVGDDLSAELSALRNTEGVDEKGDDYGDPEDRYVEVSE